MPEFINILFKLQKMATQAQLQLKLTQVTQKLKTVCESYVKLKQKIKSKDQQIQMLKLQLQKYVQKQQMKQNSRIQQIRKKYEMEPTFRPSQKFNKLHTENYEGKSLKNVKSLSPHKFNIHHVNLNESDVKKSKQPMTSQTKKQQKIVRNPFSHKINEFNIDLVEKSSKANLNKVPAPLQSEKSRQRRQQIEQLDHVHSRLTKQERKNESQSQVLRQLWEQRDKEIKRMDDLFESIEKKIKESK